MGGEGDLVGDPATERLRVQAPRGDQLGLLVDPGSGEGDHLGVLRRGQRRPQLLEHRDPVDARRRGHRGVVDRGVGELGEAGEHRGQLRADRVTRLDPVVRTHVRKLARPTDTVVAPRTSRADPPM